RPAGRGAGRPAQTRDPQRARAAGRTGAAPARRARAGTDVAGKPRAAAAVQPVHSLVRGAGSAGRDRPGRVDAEAGAGSAVPAEVAAVGRRERLLTSPSYPAAASAAWPAASASSRALAATAAGRDRWRCAYSEKAARGWSTPVRM